MFLELAHIKKHLNIDADYTDDDEYILYLYDVAVDVIQKHIDITFDEIMQKEGKYTKCPSSCTTFIHRQYV